jgi:hypothetical protein
VKPAAAQPSGKRGNADGNGDQDPVFHGVRLLSGEVMNHTQDTDVRSAVSASCFSRPSENGMITNS